MVARCREPMVAAPATAIKVYNTACWLLKPNKIKATAPMVNMMVSTGFKWKRSANTPPPIAPTMPPMFKANKNNMLAPNE